MRRPRASARRTVSGKTAGVLQGMSMKRSRCMGPYAKQIIATVIAWSKKHIDVRLCKQRDSLLQALRRQGWGIAINGHHPGAPQVQEILQAMDQALPEFRPLLCNERKIWRDIDKEVLSCSRRIGNGRPGRGERPHLRNFVAQRAPEPPPATATMGGRGAF
jgi:hypothetical protein